MKQTPPTRKAYPSDLRAGEWALLEPLVPAVKPGGRPARWSRREIVNAILYVIRGGNQWRGMPHDPPPRHTASGALPAGRNARTFETHHIAPPARARGPLGGAGEPPPAVAASPSLTTDRRARLRLVGWDAAALQRL